MEEKDILHVGEKDFIGGASGRSVDDVIKSAVRAKAGVDQEFEKVALAAAAAGGKT